MRSSASIERRITNAIATIDVDPDGLHQSRTPAVMELIAIGPPALPRVLDLMLAENVFTRVRARTAFFGIIAKEYGFDSGKGWKTRAGEANYHALVRRLGDLNPDEPLEARQGVVQNWKRWLSQKPLRDP